MFINPWIVLILLMLAYIGLGTISKWFMPKRLSWEDYPCHKKLQKDWCDHSGPGDFMGHTCHFAQQSKKKGAGE